MIRFDNALRTTVRRRRSNSEVVRDIKPEQSAANPETKEETEKRKRIARSRVPCLNNKIKPTLSERGSLARAQYRQQQVDILFPAPVRAFEGRLRKKMLVLSSDVTLAERFFTSTGSFVARGPENLQGTGPLWPPSKGRENLRRPRTTLG